jgi:hypothetical protein
MIASIQRYGRALCLVSAFLSNLPIGCNAWSESDSSPEPKAKTTPGLISDETQHQGVPGFVFLPPIVPPPASYGDVVLDLPVSVRIDELNAAGAVVRTLSTFTATSGPKGERLRTHLQSEVVEDADDDEDPSGYYYARWLTHDEHLSPSARYRIRVLVPAKGGRHRELGFADVDLVRTTRAFRRVDAHEFTPLINGTTLRIKFRVDRQAVDADGDGAYDWLDNCPNVANVDQVDSMSNGIGDACRCTHTRCPPRDACHESGQCDPTTGQCTEATVPDGRPCPMAHADAICVGGNCELQSCRNNYSDCNGSSSDGCETTLNSKENCGGCGLTCPDAPDGRVICRSGQCVLRCPSGTSDCDADFSTGCEVDTRSDPYNCGACGNLCPDQRACIRGGCSAKSCQFDWASCDGIDANGCEVNTTEDARNCGACQHDCGNLPNAVAGCSGAECRIVACVDGFGDCNDLVEDGCELDVLVAVNNCGTCGSPCEPMNAVGACVAGQCTVGSCTPGFADCDDMAETGCESDLGSDVNNCGACGAACSVLNGSARCGAGTCHIASCNTDTADCNATVADGCEVQLTADASNCGACGSVCPGAPNATGVCTAGTCAQACLPGFANCDGDPDNGCEVDVSGNCGVCGNACELPHATGTCANGTCEFSACATGYADCDGLASNGCEVELASDANHCSACDVGCARPNRAVACVNGACVAGACQQPYADCDGKAENGCEANLDGDAQNCQSCGNVCIGGSVCRPMNIGCRCPDATCFMMPGPCPDLRTDPANCGACGERCLNTEVCVDGKCQCSSDDFACGSRTGMHGYSCCPRLNATCGLSGMCITHDIQTEEGNCGAIGHVCASGEECIGGICKPPGSLSDPNNCGPTRKVCPPLTGCVLGACTPSQTNCDGITCPPGAICFQNACMCPPTQSFPTPLCNGTCGIDYSTDASNCGSCGHVCPVGTTCVASQCV